MTLVSAFVSNMLPIKCVSLFPNYVNLSIRDILAVLSPYLQDVRAENFFYSLGHMTLYICRCLWGYQWPSVWWCRHDGFQEITCLMVCSWCVLGDPVFDGVLLVGLKRSCVWLCGPGGFQEFLDLMVWSWWFKEIPCLMVWSWWVSGDPVPDGVVLVGLKRSRVWWCGPSGFQEILYLMVLSRWVLIKDSMTFYWLAALFMSSTIIYLTWFHWFIFRGWCL